MSDILVNGPRAVYIERRGKLERTRVIFRDDTHLLQVIERIVSAVGRRVDESSPMVDARLPDGSRINAIIPPLALDGPVLSIRRFAVDPLNDGGPARAGYALTPALVGCHPRRGQGPPEHADLGRHRLRQDHAPQRHVGVRSRTTSASSPIEDSAELQLQQEHMVALETRPANVEGAGERDRSGPRAATRSGCGPTGSSSARCAAPRCWTCCRP